MFQVTSVLPARAGLAYVKGMADKVSQNEVRPASIAQPECNLLVGTISALPDTLLLEKQTPASNRRLYNRCLLLWRRFAERRYRECSGGVDLVFACRGTSPIRKPPSPYDPPKTLGIGLWQGPRGVRFLMSEVPLS